MSRWIALLSAMVMGWVPSAASAQNAPPAEKIETMREVKPITDRRNHRFAPFRNRNDNEIFHSGRERDIRSWNRYSRSRAGRLQERRGLYPRTLYYGTYDRNGMYGDRFGGHGLPFYGFGNFDDLAEIEFNQSGYDDGPYGPGQYDRNRWFSWYGASHRTGQLLDINQRKVDQGMQYFRAGRYDRAAIAWLGASRADHGDAGSRIHAGHALFAVGRYSDAVKLIGRGFELAPRLATSTYDIRADYGNPADFDRHLATLKNYVIKHPTDISAVTLLGYTLNYTDGPAAAYPALRRARQLDPQDTFVEKLWETARLVSPPADLEVPREQDEEVRQPVRRRWQSEKETGQPGSARPSIKRVRWTEHR
ncbi:MAG: hypothetical protein MI923_11660 [Phycisphaerales bacterium]|nr:hypothetical protein [Phycisphaerales bacterium]